MVIRGIKPTPVAIVGVLIFAVCYDGYHLVRDERFNDAVASGNTSGMNDSDDPYRQFARAYAIQQAQDFKATVKAYADIEPNSNRELQMDVKFNLANLYFREAKQLRDVGDDDLAMPLIELAKQNYRDVLRIDSSRWDAKFNLELALVVAPETDPVDPLEEVNPERSPRALTKMQLREPLP